MGWPRVGEFGLAIRAPGSPAALAALQKADFEKWAGIIKIKGIKGE